MVNGKIILGTLSIIVALVIFFDAVGEFLSGNGLPIILSLIAILAATLGITFVRSGLSGKRKTS